MEKCEIRTHQNGKKENKNSQKWKKWEIRTHQNGKMGNKNSPKWKNGK